MMNPQLSVPLLKGINPSNLLTLQTVLQWIPLFLSPSILCLSGKTLKGKLIPGRVCTPSTLAKLLF